MLLARPSRALPFLDTRRIAMLSDAPRRRMIERRVILNRPYVTRESPSIIRIPSILRCRTSGGSFKRSVHSTLISPRIVVLTCVARNGELQNSTLFNRFPSDFVTYHFCQYIFDNYGCISHFFPSFLNITEKY